MSTQDTSREAFHDIQPELGDRQHEVLKAFRTHGPMTNTELSRIIGLPINMITPRTNELVKLGFVKEHSRRPCKITGRRAIVWGTKETLL